MAPVTREDILKTLSEHRSDLRRFGIESLAVFGSVARGEATSTSDVDVLAQFGRPVGMFEFLDAKAYLESLLGREVDLVTPDALKHQLRERILGEAVHAF